MSTRGGLTAIAQGQIRINTSDLERAGQVTVAQSRVMAESMKKVSAAAGALQADMRKAFQMSAGSVQADLRSHLAQTTVQLRQVAQGYDQLGAAAQRNAQQATAAVRNAQQATQGFAQGLNSAFGHFLSSASIGIGFGIANQFQRVDVTIRNLAGSAEAASAVLADMRDISNEFGIPFNDLRQSAAAFLPVARSTGVELNRLVILSQRLLAANPMENVSGAAFALREGLSGDMLSLQERFFLSRAQGAQLREALASGGTEAFLTLLDQMLNEVGATEEALRDLGQSGVNAFDQIKSSVLEAVASGFAPLLQTIQPVVASIAQFISTLAASNPELLQFITVLGVAALAAGPLQAAITGIAGAFGSLRQMAASATPLVRGAFAGVAAAGGVGAGLAVARGLANAGVRTGDLGRIAEGEDPGAILSERLAQILVLVVNALIEFARGITTVGAHIANAIDQLINVIELAGTYLQEAFGGVVTAVEDIARSITEALFGELPDQLETPFARAAESEAERRGMSVDEFIQRFDAGEFVNEVFFDPILNEFNAQARQFGRGGAFSLRTVINNEGEGNERYIAATRSRGAQIVDDAQTRREGLLQELSRGFSLPEDVAAGINATFDDIRSTVITGLSQTLGLIKTPQTAGVADAVAALGGLAPVVDPLTAAFARAQSALEPLVREFEQATADIAARRGLQDTREQQDFTRRRDQQTGDFWRGIGEQDADFAKKRSESWRDLLDELGDLETEANADRAKKITDFNKDAERRAEDHQKKLKDIEDEGRKRLYEAASMLDAIGVDAALRSMEEQRAEEEDNYATENRRLQEDLDAQLTELAQNLDQQRAQRILSYQQQQTDEAANYEQSRARRIAQFEEQLAREDEERAIRAERLAEDRRMEDELRQRDFDQRRSKILAEAGVFNEMAARVAASLQLTRDSVLNFLTATQSGLGNWMSKLGDSIGQLTTKAVKGFLGGSNKTSGGGTIDDILHYAAGGKPPVGQVVQVGEFGPEYAMFTDPVQIYTANQMRQIAPETLPAAAGGQGRAGLSIGTFAPNFNFAGATLGGWSEADLRRLAYQAGYEGSLEGLEAFMDMLLGDANW